MAAFFGCISRCLNVFLTALADLHRAPAVRGNVHVTHEYLEDTRRKIDLAALVLNLVLMLGVCRLDYDGVDGTAIRLRCLA